MLDSRKVNPQLLAQWLPASVSLRYQPDSHQEELASLVFAD